MRKPAKVAAVVAIALAFLCGYGMVACERTSTEGVAATQPRAVDMHRGGEGTVTPPPEALGTGVEPEDQALFRPDRTEPEARTIDMDEASQPEPKVPRFVEVAEEIEPERLASVQVNVVPPSKLVLDTDNIKRLRLTREGLPLSRHRSIVLRIDGQGIEWTPKYVAVELERSSTGAWTVVRRRAYQP
jgi:hypothetical protein